MIKDFQLKFINLKDLGLLFVLFLFIKITRRYLKKKSGERTLGHK